MYRIYPTSLNSSKLPPPRGHGHLQSQNYGWKHKDIAAASAAPHAGWITLAIFPAPKRLGLARHHILLHASTRFLVSSLSSRNSFHITSENWKTKFGGNGVELTSNCRQCLERAAETCERRGGALPLDTYLQAISEAGDINFFSALVDISSLREQDDTEKDNIEAKELTDKLAGLVWEAIGY
ncbi:hypothetical protein B0H14DRAFT_2557423 [Mycena olivaceomarginata]|nr:hypothetical protein B0H14DRAFT_2557423 [Mycena olivaceomarginata]